MDSPRYVFVDTSTYEELKMEWSGVLLDRLATAVEEGRVVLVTTTITKQELHGRIEFHARQHQKDITSAAKSAAVLGAQSIALPQDHGIEATRQMTAFFERTKPVVVNASGVDCEQVLNRFFKREPPFSTRKKHEFPDAIAGLALSNWAVDQNVLLTVVADDKDWNDMVEYLPRLESSMEWTRKSGRLLM